MTEAQAVYAAAQRLACQPVECTQARECWVALGSAESLSDRIQGTPRCAACGGKIRIDEWRSPNGYKASTGGGRSRGADIRGGVGVPRMRDSARPKGANDTPASEAPS
jgi:hypothetical protein